LAYSLSRNYKLVLVVDENKPDNGGVAWREMYDPDLSHLVNASALPTQVLNHAELEGHLEGIETEGEVNF